jgi:hypothetical protein
MRKFQLALAPTISWHPQYPGTHKPLPWHPLWVPGEGLVGARIACLIIFLSRFLMILLYIAYVVLTYFRLSLNLRETKAQFTNECSGTRTNKFTTLRKEKHPWQI